MNSSNENYLSCQQSTNWEEQTIEKEIDFYNNYTFRIQKKVIQIKFPSDQQIIYSQNEEILRVEKYHDVFKKPEMFNKMDQIHNLSWQGQYNKNKKKDGKCNIMDSEVKIFETGEYANDIRIGKWNYIYFDDKIDGGFYNKDVQKQGKWIVLDEGFKHYTGVQIGTWDIMYCKWNENKYKQIGGGSYDQQGNQKKIGKWIESDKEFEDNKQVINSGKYNLNGMKLGRWDIKYCKYDQNEYKHLMEHLNECVQWWWII